MKIPNAENAVVDIAKIRDYCLSQTHLRGRHKARVFASALGLTEDNADYLRVALLTAVKSQNAVTEARDKYGQRYILDFVMTGPGGTAHVRSLWIVLDEEDFPRFTTCYVL